jgi:hypothetical protein
MSIPLGATAASAAPWLSGAAVGGGLNSEMAMRAASNMMKSQPQQQQQQPMPQPMGQPMLPQGQPGSFAQVSPFMSPHWKRG